MRACIQRVSSASVTVDGQITGEIDRGLLVLLGIGKNDDESHARWLAEKCVTLRIFEDAENKMNLSLQDVRGQMLVVSQFTLFGDCRKGRRPSFIDAAPPETGNKLYEYFCDQVRGQSIEVQTGQFQAHMDVALINDGPVTILIDSEKRS